MAETFDTLEVDEGSGGALIAGDTFSQSAVDKFVPASYIVYGAAGGPYERVDTATPLPVAIISGQTGITAGAGSVAANTPRVTHASDDPAVTHLASLAGAAFTDDAAYTPASSKLLVIGGQCDASGPDSVDEGDAGACRITADRALHTSIRDAAGNNRGLNVGASGELLAAQSGTWNVGTVTTVSTVTTITNAVTVAQATASSLNCTEASASAIKTAVELLDDTVYVDDADFTDGASKGILKFGLYQSTPQNITDGDVGPVQVTTEGYQIVRVNGTVTVGSHAVTNAGTFVVQENGAALTALQLIDNVISTHDSATASTSVAMIGAEFDDSSPDTVDEGDAAKLRISSRRELYTQLRDAAGNERGLNVDANGAASVVGAVAHDAAASGNPVLVAGYASAAAPSDVSGDADAVRAWFLRNGAQATVVTAAGALIGGDATNGLDVDVTRVIAGVTATAIGKAEDAAHTTGDTGVFVLAVRNDTHTSTLTNSDNDYSPIAVDSTGKVGIRGTYAEDVAHTGGDLGHFVLAVRADSAAATAGADGDYSALIVDATGRLWCNVSNTVAVSVAAGATNIAKAEDAAHSSQDTGVYVLAVRDDTLGAHSGTDGDYESLHTNADGALWTIGVSDATILSTLQGFDGAIKGPSDPTIDSFSTVTVNASANTADQQLVAAPGANKQIWVFGINGAADTGSGSISFQDEDNTAITGVIPIAQNASYILNPSGNFSMPWWKVTTNKALEIDTVTCGFKGSICYGIASV